MGTFGPNSGTVFATDSIIGTIGVEISAIADIAGTAQIDYVSITVDYTGSNRGTSYSYLKVGDGMSRNEAN